MQSWSGVAGKRVVITGATAGIGLAAAEALAARGARLTIVARDRRRGEAAAARIAAAARGAEGVEVLHADFASLRSVRELGATLLERHRRIDVLVNNAGAMYARRQRSADGFELTWAVNHLAPFLLTNLLLERLRESAPARIVTTASEAHRGNEIPFDDVDAERSYSLRGFRRYGESKLANILFTLELARRLESSGVTANCLHPGMVATGFNRNNGPAMTAAMILIAPFSSSPERGADTLVWLVESPAASGESGGYFQARSRRLPSPQAQDAQAARRLWELSEAQLAAAGADALQ